MKSIPFSLLVAALAVMLGQCDRQIANRGRASAMHGHAFGMEGHLMGFWPRL